MTEVPVESWKEFTGGFVKTAFQAPSLYSFARTPFPSRICYVSNVMRDRLAITKGQ
jgi:hypothetical protein